MLSVYSVSVLPSTTPFHSTRPQGRHTCAHCWPWPLQELARPFCNSPGEVTPQEVEVLASPVGLQVSQVGERVLNRLSRKLCVGKEGLQAGPLPAAQGLVIAVRQVQDKHLSPVTSSGPQS